MNRDRLLERFLRYVRIDTTANDTTDDYPSCAGQLELGRVLVNELREIGLSDVVQDQFGLIYATVPATVSHAAPTIAFNAHLDTSPETTGANVQPQVLRNYNGGDILLSAGGQVIRVANNPELNDLHGKTLITTDGTTLLGGDDKAGVAVMVELAAHLQEHPDIQHGPVRLLFTCDEEIGRGTAHVDLEKLGATVAYTFDGGGANEIDVETFSADLATITFRGVNIHPSIAQGRMVNAVRAAGIFLTRLPKTSLAPEVTSGRDGFLHPYQIAGGVAEVQLKILLRDFESGRLAEHARQLEDIAQQVQGELPGCQVQVTVSRQYRNLREGLEREPRAVAFAERAHQRLGREPKQTIIRGGTDGSLLTERGLPTPNLSVGQHNLHSPLEWVCLEEMVQALEIAVELIKIWADEAQ